MKSKKLLLISQVFYPDQVSTASLFTDMCSVLAEDGLEVEVWAGHPSYTVLNRQPENLVYKGINITYLRSTNFPKDNLSGRLLNMLTFTASVCIKILFSRDKTPVWTHTTPPLLGIILSFICFCKKRKFIYILLDIFPEGLIRLGKVSGRNPIIRLWQWMFFKSLSVSTKIIAIGRDIKSWIDNNCIQCNGKTEYIPHWQDDKLIFPLPFNENKFIIEEKLTERFVIQYSGNMGLWNELKTIGKVVRRNIENVEFIFVGGGVRKNELLEEFSLDEQKNVLFMPFQPNEVFNEIISASHVHLVTLRDGLEGMAVPCKIYGILAAGRPVIAIVPENSEIAYVVKEENCGIIVRPGDLDGLAAAICMLKSDESLVKQMGINSRNAFMKKYTTRVIAESYKKVLSQLYDS